MPFWGNGVRKDKGVSREQSGAEPIELTPAEHEAKRTRGSKRRKEKIKKCAKRKYTKAARQKHKLKQKMWGMGLFDAAATV